MRPLYVKPVRAAVVLVRDGYVALIRRRRGGAEYWLFPGGAIEPGETAATAAIREVKEELGLDVRMDRLIATVRFGASTQFYFAAVANAGVFGSGTGDELALDETSSFGSYEPRWVPIEELERIDIRPREVARLVALSPEAQPAGPIEIVEAT